MKIKFEISSSANPDDLAVIENGLDRYNKESSNLIDVKPLHVIATGNDGKIYGGAIGRTCGECCELQEIWIDAGFRGKGAGTEIMDFFEKEASNRNCKLIYLSTFNFQAPHFYKKRGYKEVLRITGFSQKEEKIHMQKKINS